MNFNEQDRQWRFLVARASSPCCGQAGSLPYHFLVGAAFPILCIKSH
jgi:hypothetical protein